MGGPSLTSVVAGVFVVAIVALLVLVLQAEGASPLMAVVEGVLALFMVYAGFRVSRDVKGGRA